MAGAGVSQSSSTTRATSDVPVTPEDEWTFWDARLTDLKHGQLETVQKAATAWASLFGALVGVFGAVAFGGGLASVDRLPGPWDVLVKAATLGAITLALVTIYLAAKAGEGLSPKTVRAFDAKALMLQTYEAAQERLATLRRARMTGVAVISILVGGAFVVLLVGREPQPAPSVVAIVDGKAVCGKLASGGHGQALKIGSTSLDAAVASLDVVSSCP